MFSQIAEYELPLLGQFCTEDWERQDVKFAISHRMLKPILLLGIVPYHT